MLVFEAGLDFCVAEHGVQGRGSRGFREEAETATFVGGSENNIWELHCRTNWILELFSSLTVS